MRQLFQEINCPITGNDSDLETLVWAGADVYCHWCGSTHHATAEMISTFSTDDGAPVARIEFHDLPASKLALDMLAAAVQQGQLAGGTDA